jgi:predicted NAD-dependent protein-ADP-ribosyltransferase YbiA (DUF1768 family)
MSVVGPFRGEYYCFTSYYRSPLQYTLPTNGYAGHFQTLEHIIQAAKCSTREEAQRFNNNFGNDPRLAHKQGLVNGRHHLYDAYFAPMLEDINILKFTTHTDLANRLVKTGSDYLVYYNYWHDTKLGVCACSTCRQTGNNLLGVILMGIRSSFIWGRTFGDGNSRGCTLLPLVASSRTMTFNATDMSTFDTIPF